MESDQKIHKQVKQERAAKRQGMRSSSASGDGVPKGQNAKGERIREDGGPKVHRRRQEASMG